MSSIYIKHPHEDRNVSQELFLSKCDESERLFHVLMFNYGNATYRYHEIEPTEEDYEQWLEGLPEKIRISFAKLGYENNKSALPLKRFANEMRDIGMDEYIQNLMKPEDYQAFKNLSGFKK